MNANAAFLHGLERALGRPSEATRRAGLVRWFDRWFDADGLATGCAPADWFAALESIAARGSIDESFGDRAEDVRASLEQLLRRTRPDGRLFYTAAATNRDAATRWEALARWAKSTSCESVLRQWRPRAFAGVLMPPPLPSWHEEFVVDSVIREDWEREGVWAGIEHRTPGTSSRFEMGIDGRPVFGPTWRSPAPDPEASETRRGPRASVVAARSGPTGDLVEWTHSLAGTRRSRTVVMVRGRELALFAEQVDGPGERGFEIGLDEDWKLAAGPEGPMQRLTRTARGRGIAILNPGSPRGCRLSCEPGRLIVRDDGPGPRRWPAIVVCWGPVPTECVPLTVSERSRICPDHVAVAFRLGWGSRAEGILVYRSLARPGLRAVLGLQTRARFAVGRIDRGRVLPLVTIDR
ncbi:MAG: hypothetical protein SFX72_11120 [Isosphaeraceae bacterium]|nr:hypothetical protein [Isosphaeraceae bacterium]